MLRSLTALAALVAVSAPASATLQIAVDVSGDTFFCADNGACDTNPAVGIVQVANGTINGVTVNGSIQASTRSPNFLSTSSLSIINDTASTKAITVAVGDTDFFGPATKVLFTGSGVWQSAFHSDITMNWFVDAANTQGAATATDTPGALVGAFADTAGPILDSFSTDGSGSIHLLPGEFSMTEQAVIDLTAGGQLINRGQDMNAVPEPSTWALTAIGFGFLAWAGLRKQRVQSFGV
jgi:hypothetical protein